VPGHIASTLVAGADRRAVAMAGRVSSERRSGNSDRPVGPMAISSAATDQLLPVANNTYSGTDRDYRRGLNCLMAGSFRPVGRLVAAHHEMTRACSVIIIPDRSEVFVAASDAGRRRLGVRSRRNTPMSPAVGAVRPWRDDRWRTAEPTVSGYGDGRCSDRRFRDTTEPAGRDNPGKAIANKPAGDAIGCLA
jgi:hypothetical protein